MDFACLFVVSGMDNFEALLDGAFFMDEHFRKTPLEKNVRIFVAAFQLLLVNLALSTSHIYD